MKRCFFLALLFFLTSGCGGDSSSSFIYEEDDSDTLTLTTQTELIVEDTNGNIVITGSDTTDALTCSISKKVTSKISDSDAQSHISDITVTVDNNAGNIRYEVAHPTSDSRSYEVNFDIVVPNNFNYVITLVNGNITLQSVTTSVDINLLNGTVNSDLILNDNCAVSIAVGDGDIDLTLPDTTNANLTASVVNGTINNAGLTFTNQQVSSTQFIGTLGTGDGSIVLSVGNGQIEMYKK
ncbi:MAG: DUF4097 family beta strand repeat-containing protein [Pseudomonadota bacterium]